MSVQVLNSSVTWSGENRLEDTGKVQLVISQTPIVEYTSQASENHYMYSPSCRRLLLICAMHRCNERNSAVNLKNANYVLCICTYSFHCLVLLLYSVFTLVTLPFLKCLLAFLSCLPFCFTLASFSFQPHS